MAEETVETIEVTQADPASGDLKFSDFKKARAGETVNVPKEAPVEVETPPVETETKTEEETPAKVEAEKPPKAAKSPEKRIEKLTRERYEMEDRAKAAEDEVARLRAGRAEPVKADASDPEPILEAFGKSGKTYEDWVATHARWDARQEYKAQKESEATKAAEAEQTRQLKEVFDGHNQRMMEARKVYEDLDEVVNEAAAGGNDIPRDVGMALMEMDNGPEVLYHLCTDKIELLKELGKMSPLRAIAKVGALAESLTKPEKKEAVKPSSKAPEPITPVGTGAGKADVDPENMSLADFKKYRNRTANA